MTVQTKAIIHLLIVLNLFAGCVQATDQTLINSRNMEKLRTIALYIWDS